MASGVACGCVLFLCILYSATSFNLEPRIPVIKFGEPGSYFGFSVAEHVTVDKDGDSISWLLVGAPLGQNLQPNTSRSGALWKCRLSPAVRDCEQIVTDGKRTKYGVIDTNVNSSNLSGPHEDEIKDGQWLGVSVRSQGPGMKAVVCAHRYIRKSGESQFGQGLCYTLTNSLELIDVWEPCRGRSVIREHEEFGFCQVGTSSSLLQDDTLVFGSPGPYTWRGTIFTQDTNDDLLERDHVVYMAPVEDGVSPVEKYSYLGMSVAGANFFGSVPSYVAGAPRAHGTGQVVLFNKKIITDWNSPDVDILNFTNILNGEQFGSSFGYEVASADVNGDGLPDLLVGAPFYFSKDSGGAVYLYLNKNQSLSQTYDLKLTGKQESQFGIAIANCGDLNKDGCEDVAIGSPYEGHGVVYIYMGDRKNGLHTKPDQIIEAKSMPRLLKTFGYSLSGGVDVDFNGYPDLLVGAYENSSVALIRTRPIIDIKISIQPSKTIINIDPTKQGCEKDTSANYTCFHFQACCTITSLVKSTQSTMHQLNYVIEAETFPGGRKYSRVFFDLDKTSIVNKTIKLGKNIEDCREHIVYLKNNTRDIQTPIKFQVTYRLVHAHPRYSTVGTLPNIDDYPVLNATATTAFSAHFLNDCGIDGVCVSDLIVDPILQLPRTQDNKYALTLGQEEEIKLSISVDNYGESAYEGQLFVQHHASLHYIAVNITEKHVICTSVNKTIVSCLLDNPFKKQPIGAAPITLRFDARTLEDNEPSVKFFVWANSTSKELHRGKKPVEVEALVIKNAELLIKGVARPEQVFYGGEVKGESAMKYFDDIGTGIVHTYQVFNEGPWRVSSVQVVVSWPHQLAADSAQGKWLLYPEELPKVDVGAEQSNGECFITEREVNPLELKTRPGSTQPILENMEIDPFLSSGKLSIRSSEQRHNETSFRKINTHSTAAENKLRRKRHSNADNNTIVGAEALMSDGRKSVELNCQNKTAKCIKFQCVIYRLGRMQGATITVRARLWNATLVEEYARAASVHIASTAYIDIPKHYNIHQNKRQDDIFTVKTVALPDLKISEPSEVPLWLIIISVIIGLMVLIVLIIALWKLGFFKRRRPDPTLSGNLEKNHHESSPFIVRERSSFR